VRAATLLRRLLGVSQTIVHNVQFDADGDLLVEVRPTWHKPRCGLCGERAPGYDQPKQERRWRDVALGGIIVWLVYHVRRVECASCGIRVERVPWAAHDSRFTLALEELGAFLARVTDKTTVSSILGVTWRAVGSMLRRVVGDLLDPARLDGLRRIGIDEFSYRKHHRYLTVIVNHDTGKVVWAAKGKSSDTLHQFFDQLGPERVAALETITIDMSAAYQCTIEQRAPHAKTIFDRFHVQRLAHDALDEVRREVWRELRGGNDEATAKAVKKSRFSLHRREHRQTDVDRQRLSDIQRVHQPLFRAYMLKETLAQTLDITDPDEAIEQLDSWLAWASRSRLPPFVKVGRTIRQHLDGVRAYIQERLTNGIVEGTNNKLRMIARRAFGFHSPEALIAMLFLCCGGIVLDPPLPPFRTH
jgi:transposase